jgi:hypothetical protein
MFSKKQITPDVLLHTNQLAAIRQLISLKTAGSFLFDHVLKEQTARYFASSQLFPS